MSIVLERDIQRTQMLTGGYLTKAAIDRGGKFKVGLSMHYSYFRIDYKLSYKMTFHTIFICPFFLFSK